MKSDNFIGICNGWSKSSIKHLIRYITLFLAVFTPLVIADNSDQQNVNFNISSPIVLAFLSFLIANAVIPLVKASYQKKKLRIKYRSYLLTHVNDTLSSFGGAGSTEFAHRNHLEGNKSEWFDYLQIHELGVPEFFLDTYSVIQLTLENKDYIPSVSYLGLSDDLLDHASPLWQLNSQVSAAAVEYLLTQRQVVTSLNYQYSGWFFELVKSNQNDKKRWCLALENVLYDMALHYHSAIKLKKVLEILK